MRGSPLFSVVVPTYNRAHLIDKTIASALAQECADFELIVVDDGGGDNTGEVVASFGDPRVSYHWKENGERAAARNYGAARARGSYVNFLDSDDLLLPNHLSEARRLVELYESPEIFHLGYEFVDAEGRLLRSVKPFEGEINDLLLRGNLLSCDGVFLRRDIARAHPFNEDRLLSASEDWELWLRLASRYKIYYSNTITSRIVCHEQRSVLGVSEDSLLNRQKLTLKYLLEDEAFAARYGARKDLIEGEFLSYTALHLALAGAPSKALKYLRKSLLANPASLFERRFLAIVKHILLAPLRNARHA